MAVAAPTDATASTQKESIHFFMFLLFKNDAGTVPGKLFHFPVRSNPYDPFLVGFSSIMFHVHTVNHRTTVPKRVAGTHMPMG